MRSSTNWFCCALLFCALVFCAMVLCDLAETSAEESGSSTANEIFHQRIMPIFRSPNPSSCVQCHLSSVDIKDYILPSHTETFLALRENGLVDVSDPKQSKILKLIAMGDQDPDPMAKRIHEKTRRAEYDAFASWIIECCNDSSLLSMSRPDSAQSVGPEKPLEVVRHARKSRLVESFTRNVWSQRMRCFPCHTPNELHDGTPRQEKNIQRHRELVKKFGAKMNLFRETPEATMSALIASSRKQNGKTLPLINLKDPVNSLLVLKPTSKLPPKQDDGTFEKPSAVSPVSHMGGLKMHVNDHSYKMIVSWIKDYAAIVGDQYTDVEDLPKDHWTATKRILRIKGTPESWAQGTVVQLFVHAKDSAGNWSEPAVAFTQGTVTPREMVNGALLLTHSSYQDQDDFPLPPGEYQIKAYVDRENMIASDPTALLGENAYAGSATIDAKWLIGFPNAETFSGEMIAKE